MTAADFDPASAGFRSRYTTDRLLYPRPIGPTRRRRRGDPCARGDATGIDLVVPITDELGLPLADARARSQG